MNNKTQIALLGATGKLGQKLSLLLAEAGYQIWAVSRSASRALLPHENIQIIQGSATDSETIKQLAHCSIVINCISSRNNSDPIYSRVCSLVLSILGGLEKYYVIAGKTLRCRNDPFHGLKMLQRALLYLLYPAIMKDRQREYELLLKSQAEIDWTILRCPSIEDGGAKRVQALSGNYPRGKISPLSIGRFILDDLNKNAHSRETPYLAGCLALGFLSD